ncbi:hypothetical protein OAO51_00740 [Nitrosomonadaceae bacterium]|nr:hypothetical protein [Nitrosomonadaceae bacterium]
MKILLVTLLILILSACSTTAAILDVAGTTVIYAGKTVVNTVDMVTPDIVNDEDEDEDD